MPKSAHLHEQHEWIVSALRLRPHSSYDLRRLGCYQAPTRIKELREAGYTIQTHRISIVDRDGYSHPRVALYELLAEPAQRKA